MGGRGGGGVEGMQMGGRRRRGSERLLLKCWGGAASMNPWFNGGLDTFSKAKFAEMGKSG